MTWCPRTSGPSTRMRPSASARRRATSLARALRGPYLELPVRLLHELRMLVVLAHTRPADAGEDREAEPAKHGVRRVDRSDEEHAHAHGHEERPDALVRTVLPVEGTCIHHRRDQLLAAISMKTGHDARLTRLPERRTAVHHRR